jgi:hypothetical protein
MVFPPSKSDIFVTFHRFVTIIATESLLQFHRLSCAGYKVTRLQVKLANVDIKLKNIINIPKAFD